tara:strand:- start:7196 stop:8464 length:1269 start_codon:yes stop_codon:yes gene_type:complete
MSCTVVVGTQWGDEGKGKIVDLLTQESDLVVRYQGGNNAGHTVMYEDKKVVLHLVPSGILQGKECILGNGTVIELSSLMKEIKDLESAGYDVFNKLRISSQAHVILDYHLLFDSEKEKNHSTKIGTTCKGIGPVYEDKVARTGLRICDLKSTDILRSKLECILPKKNADVVYYTGKKSDFDIDKMVEKYHSYYKEIKSFLIDCSSVINNTINKNKNILFEGAQGTFLDVDHGTYPYVTSSNTLAGAACTGSGIGPTKINRVIGITKAYTTRVGSGPFPTEITSEKGEYLRQMGDEYGATTGRPRRCGWFDAVLVKRAVELNGITELALMKLDVLDNFEEIKICSGYNWIDGGPCEEFPIDNLSDVKPFYHVIPGWKKRTRGITNYKDVPDQMKYYIEQIEWYTQCKVGTLSTGPKREETVEL